MTLKEAQVVARSLHHIAPSKMTKIQKDLMVRCNQVIRTHRKPLRNPKAVSQKTENQIWRKGFDDGYYNRKKKSKNIVYLDGYAYGKVRRSDIGYHSNPPTHAVKIYGKVLRMEAQKIGPHRCDPGCVKTNHCYYHDFTAGAVAWGMPDGSVLLKSSKGKRLWGMF